MTLGPSILERLTRARGDLRMGVPVVLAGGGEAALAVAVEPLDPARLQALRGFGRPELALTARRAETLKTPPYDGDLLRVALPEGAALAQMGEAGAGVLLYLNPEGRGIGLANKMRAYSLQDQGFDTVEANHRLGFEDDERDFRIGAEILRKMGFAQVRLLTNNPRKVAMLESCGLKVVERVPLKVGLTAENAGYLAVKAAKSGHLL